MAKIVLDLSVCDDCLFALEYGPHSPSHDIDARSRVAVRDFMKANPAVGFSAACDSEAECGFTWAPCDVCGQTGRNDHRAIGLR